MNRYIRLYLVLFILSYFLIVLIGVYIYPTVDENVWVFNIVTAICYCIVLFFALNKNTYSTGRLISIILIFNFIFTAFFLLFFYFYTGRLFSFTAIDSLYYQGVADSYYGKTFSNAIEGMLSESDIDDIGFPLYLSLIYAFVNEIVVARLAMVLVVGLSAFYTYKIGINFLERKFAFIATLLFYLSPAVFLFSSNGLKENFMLLIVNATFYWFVKYQRFEQIKFLIYSFIVGSAIVLFRIPYIFFIILSIASTLLLIKKRSSIATYFYTFIIISIVGFIIYYNYQNGIDRFTSIDRDYAMETVTSATSQSSSVAFLTSIFIALFGPLPSFFAVEAKFDLTILAVTPYIKVLLTPLFFVGLYYTYKLKNAFVVPLAIFILINLISLVSIASSFEFRFHYVNFPFIFLISLYGLQQSNRRTLQICYIAAIVFIIPVLIWNFGRF